MGRILTPDAGPDAHETCLQVGDREIKIRAVPARSERIRDGVEEAYAAKHPTPGSRTYVRGFRTKRRREATMEFMELLGSRRKEPS